MALVAYKYVGHSYRILEYLKENSCNKIELFSLIAAIQLIFYFIAILQKTKLFNKIKKCTANITINFHTSKIFVSFCFWFLPQELTSTTYLYIETVD
jgi:hypothetical protein